MFYGPIGHRCSVCARLIGKLEEGKGLARKNRGFSLLEVAMVIAIMLIVLAIAVPNLTSINASYVLDGSARGIAALVQRSHFDAISDTTGYRVLLYASTSATNANSYKRQRLKPPDDVFPKYPPTPSTNWEDLGDPIVLPSGVDISSNAPTESAGVHVISFDSAGDVVDLNDAYITADYTVTVTNDLGNSLQVTVSGTSHVSIQ